MFTGINEDICRKSWEIVKPSVLEAKRLDVTNKVAGTYLVLNPWTGGVMFRAQLDPDHVNAPLFNQIAESKAEVSWETGMTSREVQQNAPHLYRPGWTKWGGSAVEFKLVVAFSGVQAVFDEAISWSGLAWILGMCRDEMTRQDGVMASASAFVGM